MSGAPLRVVVVMDSFKAPAWVAQAISDIRAAAFVELAGLLMSETIPGRPASASKKNSVLFERYVAWDKDRNCSELDPLSPVDLSSELAGIPALQWTALSADVVLWFSSRAPVTLPSQAARFGVWFYQTDELTCFWELYDRQTTTSSRLMVLHGLESPPSVITEQFAAAETGWSLSRNRTVAHWKAPALILKSLRQLQKGLDPVAPVLNYGSSQSKPSVTAESAPSNAQMARFLAGNAARAIHRHTYHLGRKFDWFIAYRTNREKFISQTEKFNGDGFTVISAPKDHFYADPFVLEHSGRNFVFFEDYLYQKSKGVISVLEIGERGPVGEARRVLERPYHLSYPFTFEHEGGIYMIPETFYARRIELYRASHFPDRWELVAVLKDDVDAADTTLWIENGVFYFFTSIAEKGTTASDFLHLFCADSLTGKWRPHPCNPLSSDVRNSRGAGKLFKRHGKLIRPAQDCSVRYGYACQLNEIKILSPDQYLEAPLFRIEPSWARGLIGTHTINGNQRLEVIDGQVYQKKSFRRYSQWGVQRLVSGFSPEVLSNPLPQFGDQQSTPRGSMPDAPEPLVHQNRGVIR